MSGSFDGLVAEGDAEPTEGWDFSWFAGRATEERTPWGYHRLAAERLGAAHAALDVQTGGAEVFAEALTSAASVPARVAASEEWPPNLEIARDRLAPFGGDVAQVLATEPLPFADESFDLVLTRHPKPVQWQEIGRVLAPGGTFLGQLIGWGTNRKLYEFFLGPQDDAHEDAGHEAVLRQRVAEAGLTLERIDEAVTKVEFFDVGAVVYFLRKVLWTVPGFTVSRHRSELERMHTLIEARGSFVSYSRRFLVEARRR
ncbi:class I SAM-dependent methyltransferase [Gryllotalpicola reticulitermitis]|uniref:Class I SAM-dependent methyltransferase n=1 Tax=Gryllotalpicola reticulitermitis TaxID=1184153 RepID=A0ABV8Q5Y0_9MICO